MLEELVRRDLPIQSIKERGEDLTATVPVHLRVLRLPASVRIDQSLISDAREIVSAWYNEDMEYHIRCLELDGYDLSIIEGYERFNDDWILKGEPDINGFLSLSWDDGIDVGHIGFVKSPVVYYNQFDENKKFYTPDSALKGALVECLYRSLRDSETIWMDPDKMKKYGIECRLAKIDVKHGVAEVVGQAFCSDYQQNMGKALLLRDFAVFYLNKLFHLSGNVDPDPSIIEQQILEAFVSFGSAGKNN